jgi:hypothetical protein
MIKKNAAVAVGGSDLACVQSAAPPAHFRRADVGAEGFWRGAVGDSIYGVLLGPAHEGLAGAPGTEQFPKVVAVLLLADTIGLYKPEGADEKKARVFKEGEMIYVNLWYRTREALTQPQNTGVWIKVTGEEKIPGGKTVKIVDSAYGSISPASAQIEAGATTAALPAAS